MPLHRRLVCLLLAVHAAVWAQAPLPAEPMQPDPQPGEPLGQPPAQPVSMPATPAPQAPLQGNVPNAPGSAASKRFADLPAVTIREFRSSVSEVPARGATDMFIAALVKTRKFRVLERSRMAEGVAAEKALNQQGVTTGNVGRSQYLGATYLFEATISEVSAAGRTSSFTLGLAGAAAGQGESTDSIAIDVRVIDVESGVVVDAVTVRKEIRSVETKVAGVASALANLLTRRHGGAVADVLAPDDRYVSTRKDSVDRSLRSAVEEAVADLVKQLATR